MELSGPSLKKLLSGVNFPSSKVKKIHSEKKKSNVSENGNF